MSAVYVSVWVCRGMWVCVCVCKSQSIPEHPRALKLHQTSNVSCVHQCVGVQGCVGVCGCVSVRVSNETWQVIDEMN